jgi:UDP-N-acetylmuramoyl-L-alanyl-D-glutamate--2,6-diaminopimelate ligase
MVTLKDIVSDIEIASVTGDDNISVTGIFSDSRKVIPGSLFVAVKGTRTDGHDHIESAIRSGARAVICERLPENPVPGICFITTTDSASALGLAASAYFGKPSSFLTLVGVTGTNGKTTIATLLYRMFSRMGNSCGLFSTVCNYIIDKELPATHTTPDPIHLNSLLAEMVSSGCRYAFMEVSSHSVDQKRIAGLVFKGGIFTNLTLDHLDYHKTFDNYLAAKKGFFDSLPVNAFALTNLDDRNGKVMLQNCRAAKYTYSTRGMADFRCRIIEQDMNGMGLRIQEDDVWTRFIGEYNASNLLAGFAAAKLLGAAPTEILTLLSNMEPVPGRLEVITSPTGVSGIVDYAHTPDALKNVLETINKVRNLKGQLITVVGAGGDRDRSKRPLMASISAENSTRLILTSDNPRTENPEKILDEMEAGIADMTRKKYLRIADRREAIRTAVMLANEGDVILIAGKGHETYQDVKGVKHHFDDREELREAFETK